MKSLISSLGAQTEDRAKIEAHQTTIMLLSAYNNCCSLLDGLNLNLGNNCYVFTLSAMRLGKRYFVLLPWIARQKPKKSCTLRKLEIKFQSLDKCAGKKDVSGFNRRKLIYA